MMVNQTFRFLDFVSNEILSYRPCKNILRCKQGHHQQHPSLRSKPVWFIQGPSTSTALPSFSEYTTLIFGWTAAHVHAEIVTIVTIFVCVLRCAGSEQGEDVSPAVDGIGTALMPSRVG